MVDQEPVIHIQEVQSLMQAEVAEVLTAVQVLEQAVGVMAVLVWVLMVVLQQQAPVAVEVAEVHQA